MRLDGVLKPLYDKTDFNRIINSLKIDMSHIDISGIGDSSKAYMVYGVFKKSQKSMLLITHSDLEAKNLYEDLSLYTTEAYLLQSKPVVFYNVYAVSGDLRWERLKALREIIKSNNKIIVCSIEALASSYVPIDMYKENLFHFSVGKKINMQELGEKLVCSGYERVKIIDSKGQFSIRGGIIDIFSPIERLPFRIELFDDEVDSIRTFNIETQRSIEKINNIEVFPAKELILSKEQKEKGYIAIKKDLVEKIKSYPEKSTEMERIQKSVNKNLELLKEIGTFDTIENYIPYFYDEVSSILDYMSGSTIVLDDEERSFGKLDSIYYEFEEDYKNFLQKGDVLSKQINLIIDKSYLLDKLKSQNIITLNPLGKKSKYLKKDEYFSFEEHTLTSYQGKFDLLIQDIKQKRSLGYNVIILSGTRARGERFVKDLRESGIESSYKDIINELEKEEVVVTFGYQHKGYEYPELKVCLLSDKEIFAKGKKRLRKTKSDGVGKIKSFTELKPGDYVVHTNHGIGVYKGIKQLEVQGHIKDYLDISYNSGDKLYVPVEQLDLVQKYIGSEGKTPKVNKLGSSEWVKSKKKVKKAINEIAEDLVKLYAIRSTLKGHKFNKDTIWQKQFEEEFPFDETPDQLTAIEEIKEDMESDKVMDRLLCGDVGYGKTEVALRAAFKAVMEGKQVAFLVPTTILAEQHFNNMKKRFADFPIKIDMISRFRTQAQQKTTLKEVKAGNVDILIGTHRIIQKDVLFKELGILIVDEEQRFGVTHKEKIKEMKKNVEVLTLTATPIPRTLHMSLTGIRDISVIETPPEERYPVQTYVVEFNEQLIESAIMREISRGGQVYFVYNRVERIREMASYLEQLLPEAKIGVAHGQMRERELEKVMIDYMNNEYDVLVCTTIIETGMDIQNANTMIIYDSDKFGLSQLYQLRGRVGRTNRIAYAYLTYKQDKILSEVAEKRLKAIKDFTELGSGFKIAMRDLEIRGSGNLIGNSQHGHMASVGYDLYCKMLQNTIKVVKGEIEKEPIETTIDLKVDAFIPDGYIDDEVQKIEIYKRIAAVDSYESMMDIQEELEDRYSDIPVSVNNLINIAYIKSLANSIGVIEVKEKEVEITIKFDSNETFSREFVKGIMEKYTNEIVFNFGNQPSLSFNKKNVKKEILINILKEFFEYLNSIVETM
ncbi:transcription-repair coupling factor [Clostridium sp. DL1XJH146]